MASFSSKTSISLAFAALLSIILLNAMVSYFSSQRLSSATADIARSQELLAEIETTISALKDIETGKRGFLLTQDEAFLTPYYYGLTNVDLQRRKLPDLIGENAELQGLYRRASEKMNETIEHHSRDVARFKAGDTTVKEWVHLNVGRRLMDETRQLFALMEQSERRMLAEREAAARIESDNLKSTFVVANVASVFVIGLTFIALLHAITQRDRTAAELREARDSLEQTVRERTRRLTETNEDLLREVAERVRAESELAQSAAELERSNRELQDFAYVASHDLQEPLRKIQAFADRLQARYAKELPPEAADYLVRMDRAARRMHQLISDLLQFSRVRSHGKAPQRIDLGEILQDVLADLDERIQETGARIEIGALPAIEADPTQMRQLFQNLIGNALKFRRPGVPPEVRVRATHVPAEKGDGAGAYEIEVEDNGIGFDEKYADRIFVPFQRLHSRHEYEGTGMGLAICRRIAERHGGTILARSRPDAGSCFTVRLPVIETAEPPATQCSAGPEGGGHQSA